MRAAIKQVLWLIAWLLFIVLETAAVMLMCGIIGCSDPAPSRSIPIGGNHTPTSTSAQDRAAAAAFYLNCLELHKRWGGIPNYGETRCRKRTRDIYGF